jgi:glycosyltransferase involved in cell wall biosynthesis
MLSPLSATKRSPDDPQKVKVSFLNNVFFKRDAVGQIMHDQIRALTNAPESPYDIRIFVHNTNLDDPRITSINGPGDLLRSRHFHGSRIIIFQWGFMMDIFDLVFSRLPYQRTLTYFHNVTPSELFDDQGQRELVILSEKQIDNLFFSDFILCNSIFSMNELLARGIPSERIDVLCPVASIRPEPMADRADGGSARLLYVGRFARHKGLRELLHALAVARANAAAPFDLRMVGTLRFSDGNYIDELKSIVVAEGLEDRVKFVGEVSDSQLGVEYARAHALVMPSFHEGFCIPVIEAFGAGCYVIACDGGNLPYLAGDLGTVVAAGNIGALSDAIADFARRVAQPAAERRYSTVHGELAVKTYEEEAVRYASRYTSYKAFSDKFVATVERLLRAAADDAGPAPLPAATSGRNGESLTLARSGMGQEERLAQLEQEFADHRKIAQAAQNVIQMRSLGSLRHAALMRSIKASN